MGHKKTHKGKRAPAGYHFMPNGKLMKDSAHKKTKKTTAKPKSKMVGKRKKLDANKDGKISKADFAMLRKRKKR